MILDAKYEAANLDKVVQEQGSHLPAAQKQKLQRLLTKFEHLFDGTLGDWKTKPVSIELKEGVKPFQRKPYQVAKINETAFKMSLIAYANLKSSKDVDPRHGPHQAQLYLRSKTEFDSFQTSVNARIKRKAYQLPKLSDLMQKLEGFTYTTALDLNMGYFTIRLDKEAQDLCTIITPWGNYRYL
ncbi:MAG: hypothetical protein ACREBR_00720 [bacterium]